MLFESPSDRTWIANLVVRYLKLWRCAPLLIVTESLNVSDSNRDL